MGRKGTGARRWVGAGVRAGAAITVASVALCTGSGAAGAGERSGTEDLIEQADAICAAAGEELLPLFAQLFPTGTETPPAEEAAPVMAEAAQIITEEVRDLTALKPSLEVQAEWLDIERLLRRLDHLVRRSAQLAAAGDTEGYLMHLGAANEVDWESREIFRSIGSTVCAGDA